MRIGFITFSDGAIILGAGYVVASLMRAGHLVKLFNIDKNTHDVYRKMLMEKISLEMWWDKYDVVLLSIMTMDLPCAIDTINHIKKYADIPVVVGGVHPTVVKGELLNQYPQIDYICVGEGESAMVEFLENMSDTTIKNIGWRDKGEVRVNPIRIPEDLKTLPKFQWWLYPKKSIVDQYGFTFMRATRGCPMKCTFCNNTSFLELYGKDYLRKRDIPDVIREMKYLVEQYHPKLICFSDEMLIWDKEYSIALFQEIHNEVNIPFGFMARTEFLSQKIIESASECGCKYVGIGVECGDESFRKEHLNRHMSNQQIESAFRSLNAHNIYTCSFNMIGYPFPNDDYLTESTIAFNKKINPGFAQFSIFRPFPGTELYDKCIRENLIDANKEKITTTAYTDSILKGVSLRDRRIEIESMFCGKGFFSGVL